MEKKNDISSKEKTLSLLDITAVALLYNYLANNKTILSTYKISTFFDYLKKANYHNDDVSYKFVYSEETSNKILEQSVKFDLVKCEVFNIANLASHYETLPKDFINKTLTSEALQLIGIERNQLKIATTTRNYYDHIDVYAMGQRDAIEKSVNCLETYGFKNIKITRAFYLGMKDDHLYSVSYNADKDFESLDLDDKKVKVKVFGKENIIL
ncbi:MAG: hypothetical protein IK137_00735 [Bacilli bacterium]|nr:hypothetical protein [Bacilli bacterium]